MARLVFKSAAIVAACAFFTGVTAGTPAPAWGQCGGQSWTGPTTCIDYWCCIVQNNYFSQCLQYVNGCPGATATGTAAQPTETVFPGGSYLRSNTEPYEYMQSVNGDSNAPGAAILGNFATAGKFTQSEQIQMWVPSNDSFLFVNVQPPANSSVTNLPVTFEPKTNGYGYCGLNGSILNFFPNTTSGGFPFMTCQNNDLHVNLALDTPSGCNPVNIVYSYA